MKEAFHFDSYERLVDNAYLGDRDSDAVLDYIARELSYAVVNVTNLFDLDAVVLYGEFSYRPQRLLSKLRERVHGRMVVERNHEVYIRFSEMSHDLAYASVCAAIINAYFDQKL